MKNWLWRGGFLLGMACLGAGCTAAGGTTARRTGARPAGRYVATSGDEQDPFTRTGQQGTDVGGPRSTGNQ